MRALAAVNAPAAARMRLLGSYICSAGTEPTRGGRVRRPGLIVANSFVNGRQCLTEHGFPLPWHGVWPWDHPPGDQCPTLGPES